MTQEKIPEHICKSFVEAFIYDGYRNFKGRFRYRYLGDCMLRPAYSAIVLFRIQQYFYRKTSIFKNKSRPSIIDKLLVKYYSLATLLVTRINFTLNAGFQASPLADIKPGLFIHHPQGIIIGGDTKIGSNCHLFKNVLFGNKDGAYPTIKDNVTLYANSVILGRITLHGNAVVTPNSVVIHDVKENTIVAGIPARPIAKNKYVFIQKENAPTLVLDSETSM